MDFNSQLSWLRWFALPCCRRTPVVGCRCLVRAPLLPWVQSEASDFIGYVKAFSGKTIILDVGASGTIDNMKEGISPDQQ
eukprot:3259652-Karenia_brevis.AAC.1